MTTRFVGGGSQEGHPSGFNLGCAISLFRLAKFIMYIFGKDCVNRSAVAAVLYRYRTSVPWRDVPERFGDWKNIHRRHRRWAESGVWEKLFKHLAQDADNEYAMIDSTIVRAHQHAAGARRDKKGLQTKRLAAAKAG